MATLLRRFTVKIILALRLRYFHRKAMIDHLTTICQHIEIPVFLSFSKTLKIDRKIYG